MDKLTIPCTKEQTLKALELGAPIDLESEYYQPTEHDVKLDSPIPCKAFATGYHYAKCPTAEQMINWLEEQENIKSVEVTESFGWNYRVKKKHDDVENWIKGVCKSRREATIAAIDAALEYLIKLQFT